MSEEILPEDSSFYSWLLISRARESLFKARQKELAPYHITTRQAYVLYVLYHLGHKATLAELAHQLKRGVNTISMQMKRMEKDGLVKKIRETPKSTLLNFELTEKGLETFYISNKIISVKDVMSVLSEEERQQLISMLEKIISKAKT